VKIRVAAGAVSIEVEGVDYTRAQLTKLANHVAGLAAALSEVEVEERAPMGFGVITEIADPPETYYEDEDEATL